MSRSKRKKEKQLMILNQTIRKVKGEFVNLDNELKSINPSIELGKQEENEMSTEKTNEKKTEETKSVKNSRITAKQAMDAYLDQIGPKEDINMNDILTLRLSMQRDQVKASVEQDIKDGVIEADEKQQAFKDRFAKHYNAIMTETRGDGFLRFCAKVALGLLVGLVTLMGLTYAYSLIYKAFNKGNGDITKAVDAFKDPVSTGRGAVAKVI